MVIQKKLRTVYFCSRCGAEHPRWQGKCNECEEWNTLIEERAVPHRKSSKGTASAKIHKLHEIDIAHSSGWRSGIAEFDRVLGGELLPGMTMLLGGEPGIGKSTLLLQVAEGYSRQGTSVLYISGEESLAQIKQRAARLGLAGENIIVANCTDLGEIMGTIEGCDSKVVFIDSIQTVTSGQFDSAPGTVAQIREAASQIISLAKKRSLAVILVGHVTKEGIVAGPKLLEHMVDTVIYFEGDNQHLYRILRATKNRHGSIREIGLFQMKEKGLVEVSNPSGFFLSDSHEGKRTGGVVTGICEGNRPLLVEIQALAASANFGNPQRVAGGFDHRKLALLLAIIEKRCEFAVGGHDIFVSVAGGLRSSDPAMDLAIVTAIVSSFTNRAVSARTIVMGEVGLSGELRGIPHPDLRVSEAAKLGFTHVVMPEASRKQVNGADISISGVKDVLSALEVLLD